MDQVGPDLWLTSIKEVMTNDLKQFDRVITVCDAEVSEFIPPSCEHYQFELISTTHPSQDAHTDYDKFAAATDKVTESLRNEDTALTHCKSGTSRSISVASAAFAHHTNQSFEGILHLIKELRPNANPSEAYLNHGKNTLWRSLSRPQYSL